MNAKKLTLPKLLTLVFVGFLVVGVIYGAIRYLILLPDGSDYDLGALSRVLWEVIPALLVLLVMYGVALTLYYNRIKTPIRTVARSIERASKERTKTGLGGEWAPVDNAVEALNASVEQYVKEREGAIALAARRKTEEAIARDMENALCNAVIPCRELDFSGAGGTERSSSICSDYFDGFYLGRRTLCFMTADVWGSGFAAARFAARAKELFREAAHTSDTLGEAVMRLNQALIENNPDRLMLSAFFAVFLPGTGELRYVNAGAHPPVMVGKERAFLRVQPGCPLGIYEEPGLTEEYLIFKPGRALVTYTNGAVEAKNAAGEAFGYDRLFDAVKEGWDRSLGAERIVASVQEAVRAFAGSTPLPDDLAVYALYYPSGIQTELSPKTSELERLRDTILDWLKDDPRKNKIFLACEEIFTNIVNHSGATSIHLNCQVEGNSFVVRFTDDGEPFNPLQVRPEGGYYNNYAEGGMGMAIIRQIAGEIFYRTQENRNVLTIRFPVIRVN